MYSSYCFWSTGFSNDINGLKNKLFVIQFLDKHFQSFYNFNKKNLLGQLEPIQEEARDPHLKSPAILDT